jgi:hypothetical protein
MTSERDDAKTAADSLKSAAGSPRPSQPLARHQVQWGRPPSSVFHAGPLPRRASALPMAEPTPVPPSQPRPGSILSGSMIPRAARKREPVVRVGEPEWVDPPVVAPPVVAPPRAQTSAPVVPSPVVARPGRDAVERSVASSPRTALEPLPDLPLEPGIVLPETATTESVPVAVTSQPVPTASQAPVPTRARARRPSRMPVYVGGGIVALLLAAGGAWLVTRPDVPAPAPVVAGAAVPPAPVASGTPVVETPVSVEPVSIPVPEPARAAAAAPAVTTSVARPAAVANRPAQAPASIPVAVAPRQAQRPPVVTTPAPQPAPPVISVRPLEVVPTPPPTAARAAPTDPDAPIQTRPQPLD